MKNIVLYVYPFRGSKALQIYNKKIQLVHISKKIKEKKRQWKKDNALLRFKKIYELASDIL